MQKYSYYCYSLINVFYCQLIIGLFLFFYISTPSIYSQTLSAENIYKKVSDAVVVILAYDYNDELAKQGSGVIINDKGYVVTNYHVLAGNERIEVLHNKEILPYLDIIGIDVERDILILQLENNKIPAIKIGDSKTINIGQRVYAIGSPMGFENTISEGIISGLRNYDQLGGNFIQITASISPGSSGGAVVNDKGELIGISTLTAKEGQNLNFAIPIDEVLSVEISSYFKNDTYKNFELFYKGINAGRKGDFKEAIKYYSQFIQKFPNNAEAYYNRGTAKNDLEDYRGAIQDFTKAVEINPNYAKAYSNRGIAKRHIEDYRGAIQDFTKAVEINPNLAKVYYNRGIAKGILKNYRSAIQDYTKAIEINQNDADVYNNRGIAKGELEDYRGAIQDYTKAIEINPNYAYAYYNRGVVKYELGDEYGGCLDWSKAGELGIGTVYDLIRKFCN